MNDDHLPCSGWSEDSTKEESGLRKGSPRSFLVAHDSDRSGRDRVLHPEVCLVLAGLIGPLGWSLYVGRWMVDRSPVGREILRKDLVPRALERMIFVWLGTVASQNACLSLSLSSREIKK